MSNPIFSFSVLTYKKRKRLPKSAFAIPEKRKYPINDLCLVGSTLIPLLNGELRRLDELVGKNVWVYSFDLQKMAIVPGLAKNIRKTLTSVDVYKIVLDNDEYFIATSNHPVLNRDGIYITIDRLKTGDSLMPFYRKTVLQREKKQYEKVYQPWYRYWDFTHHLVCREYNNKILENGYVVHHKDNNSFNNEPENLIAINRALHLTLHGEIQEKGIENLLKATKKRWANPEEHKKQSIRMKKENERRKKNKELYEQISDKIRNSKLKYTKKELEEAYKMYLDGASFKEIAIWWGCSRPTVKNRFKWEGKPLKKEIYQYNNHKVKAIEYWGKSDVYDLEVDKYHNFALQCGIFVHNSHARNALARVSAYGTPEEKKRVRNAVYRRYPQLNPKNKEKSKKK